MSEYDPALVDQLREDFGDEAQSLIDRALVEAQRLAAAWGVRLDGWLPGGTCSLVLTGEQRGAEVVVRAPLLPWEIEASLPTLLAFSGHGGVEVLEFDRVTGTTLLPRLSPGYDLSTLDDDEAIQVFAGLVHRLHAVDGSAPSLSEYLKPVLVGEFQATTSQMRTDPIGIARRLFETSPPARLLHGDAHHFNILRHGDGWVVIDPEGVNGDPAYECAAFLRNPIPQIGDHRDLGAVQRKRILRLAECLEQSPNRIWGWALVRTVQSVPDLLGNPDHPWTRVLSSLDALGEEFGGRLS